ncbi:MAG TPA: hypothetical protein VM911_21275 [Pyrinomonadaceae bacterium]|nr:hypothetical protein [Pyrinomonadaceae bacterium]
MTTNLATQIVWLFVLAVPIACIAWTVTHEEVFREPREYCANRSKNCRRLIERKFFYLFTCEYCFSHYVTALFLWLTGYKLLFSDWRGYLIGGFALVWVANQYMSIYNRLRLDIKSERVEIETKEVVRDQVKNGSDQQQAEKAINRDGQDKQDKSKASAK